MAVACGLVSTVETLAAQQGILVVQFPEFSGASTGLFFGTFNRIAHLAFLS